MTSITFSILAVAYAVMHHAAKDNVYSTIYFSGFVVCGLVALAFTMQ